MIIYILQGVLYTLLMSTTKTVRSFPPFPTFRKATLADHKAYEILYRQFEPYSDFSFNNLWIWFNHTGGLAFSEHNGNLILRLDDPFSGGVSEYTILGKNDCASTIRRVLEWQKAEALEQKLVMVPEEVIRPLANISTPDLSIVEDPNNHDYIYNTHIMHEAQGHQYAGLRRSISLFKRLYGDHIEYRDIDLGPLEQRVFLINHIHRWETTYRQDLQSQLEGTALNIYLQAVEELSVKCFAIFIHGELASFVLYHFIPQGSYGMLNHIKCNYEFKHISDFTMHAFIVRLDELGLEFENFEQDLGLAGLRTYKQSLRPYKLLKRFTITPTAL
jgi:hypothetical protein